MIKELIKKMIPWKTRNKRINKLYLKANKAFKNGQKQLSEYYSYLIYKKYRCEINGNTFIKDEINFPHPIGIVIGAGVVIGKNVTIYQNVTLGRKTVDIAEYPIIEDDVIIYCNSVILGNIRIGKGAVIGAGSIVLRDVKEGEVVHGIVK